MHSVESISMINCSSMNHMHLKVGSCAEGPMSHLQTTSHSQDRTIFSGLNEASALPLAWVAVRCKVMKVDG